ncbi:hypothetical protein LEP1GSC195_0256 [Leptospira wolbachii serovar Codice str. CDC]|uniref:Uncharacterized protein n=1 Tax=Leptospira wolbachii serovar Codice str. CDC TaxID=1218599 RepID=R9A6B0_9LEPT|nr:hypothetical protein LEP1GSC195_0256 [Leptospira wolbachii serovar Codice str. CDC]
MALEQSLPIERPQWKLNRDRTIKTIILILNKDLGKKDTIKSIKNKHSPSRI